VSNDYLKATDQFLDRLSASAHAHESSGSIDAGLLADLRREGLLGLVTPAVYGGRETDFSTLFEVIARMAHSCISTSWVVAVGNVHNWMVSAFSSAAQDEYFANPDVFSSASFAPTGTADMTTDGFIINGTWSFLSGVDHAQWVFLSGLVKESIDERPTGPWFMMIPIDAVTVDHQSWDVAGMSGTGSKDVILDNVEVPMHRAAFLPQLMANQGPGVGLHTNKLFTAPYQAALVAILAAPIYGAGVGALEAFRTYTMNRVIKMTGEKQSNQAASQITLSECAADIDTAGLILRSIFDRIDNQRPLAPGEALKIPRDTAYAVRLINKAVNTIIANAGGNSAKLDNPLQRIWRDVQVASNHAALNWWNAAQAWGEGALKHR